MGKSNKITVEDVRNFIEGNMYYMKSKSSFMKLDSHIKEQAIWRAAQCLECLKAGACTECGCATPHMFYAPKKEDAKERWGKMMGKLEWEEYKKENSLEIPNIDLAAIEVSNDYKDLDLLPPWELRSLLMELSEHKEISNNEEDETKG